MMEWIKTAANNAIITRDEVKQWLRVSTPELRALIAEQGFPQPKYGMSDRLTTTARWRVGDVRQWLDGQEHKDPAKSDLRRNPRDVMWWKGDYNKDWPGNKPTQ